MAGQLALPFFQPRLGRAPGPRRKGALTSIPRHAPAAVRVPDRTQVPLELVFPPGQPQIFVHEGVRQMLERRLSLAANAPVMLSITDNRHSMIRHSCRQGVLRVRAHHMFLDAPLAVQEALVRYVTKGDREASHLVGRYINANLHRIRPRRRLHTRLVTRGKHHDLLALFSAVNETYFDGTVDVLISWGRVRRRERGPRRSIKLGGYNAVERLISIHPMLDRGWVPRYFVSFVIYHEMLHHVIPAARGGRRAVLHSPAFRDRERAFRHCERALAWERAHIARLLRA